MTLSVCACAGRAGAELRMRRGCGTRFRRMVSRRCICFSVSRVSGSGWPLVSDPLGDSPFPVPTPPPRRSLPTPHRSSAPSHSMSSRRDTDSDTQDANDSSCKSSEKSLPDCTPHPNSISIDAGPRQAPKIAQIKRNLSYGDNSDPALEASSLPPPDPWLETSSSSPAEPAQPGACRRDGYWFLKLLQAETERLEGWCCQMDKETKENNLSEEGGYCEAGSLGRAVGVPTPSLQGLARGVSLSSLLDSVVSPPLIFILAFLPSIHLHNQPFSRKNLRQQLLVA